MYAPTREKICLPVSFQTVLTRLTFVIFSLSLHVRTCSLSSTCTRIRGGPQQASSQAVQQHAQAECPDRAALEKRGRRISQASRGAGPGVGGQARREDHGKIWGFHRG